MFNKPTTRYYPTGAVVKHIVQATKAALNGSERQHDPVCLHNTRVAVLNEIRAWTDGEDERRIYCIWPQDVSRVEVNMGGLNC